MHVRFMQMSERVAAFPGNSLFAMTLPCPVFVAKVNRYKPSTKGDKCFRGYQWAFLGNQFVTFLFDCKFWKNDTATPEK